MVSYHTHIPHYIPQYTWDGLVEPMWKLIRFCTLMADLTLVPSKTMKVCLCFTISSIYLECRSSPNFSTTLCRTS